jgi:hypothetical protein
VARLRPNSVTIAARARDELRAGRLLSRALRDRRPRFPRRERRPSRRSLFGNVDRPLDASTDNGVCNHRREVDRAGDTDPAGAARARRPGRDPRRLLDRRALSVSPRQGRLRRRHRSRHEEAIHRLTSLAPSRRRWKRHGTAQRSEIHAPAGDADDSRHRSGRPRSGPSLSDRRPFDALPFRARTSTLGDALRRPRLTHRRSLDSYGPRRPGRTCTSEPKGEDSWSTEAMRP